MGSSGGPALPAARRARSDIRAICRAPSRTASVVMRGSKSTSGTARALLSGEAGELALTYTGYDTPTAQNPGALTRGGDGERSASGGSGADSKGRAQGGTAVAARPHRRTAVRRRGVELSASAHFGWRTLDNPLTFAVVDVDRTTSGGSARVTAPCATARARASLERRHRRAVPGRRPAQLRELQLRAAADAADGDMSGGRAERGAVQLDQRERVSGIGPFVRDEIAFADRYRVTLGARADYVRFRVDDHLIAARIPDDSGERTLNAISPLVGFVARLGSLHSAYANVSTAFETPTATELANKPDGSAGINPSLDPQYATTIEAGIKGAGRGPRALRRVAVRDARAGRAHSVRGARWGRAAVFPERRLDSASRWRAGAGGVVRHGARSVRRTATPTSSSATTWSARTTSATTAFPGVPNQQLQGYATWNWRGWFATVEGQTAGGMYMDDANSLRPASWEVMNARVGGRSRVRRRVACSPVVAVSNLFDRTYAGSIVVNAAAGRYFEPAPGRTVYAGLTVSAGR